MPATTTNAPDEGQEKPLSLDGLLGALKDVINAAKTPSANAPKAPAPTFMETMRRIGEDAHIGSIVGTALKAHTSGSTTSLDAELLRLHQTDPKLLVRLAKGMELLADRLERAIAKGKTLKKMDADEGEPTAPNPLSKHGTEDWMADYK